MQSNPLNGQRIRLTVFTDDHVPQLARWLSDLGLQRLLNPGLVSPVTTQDMLSPDSWLSADRQNPLSYLWAVETQTSGIYIGICALITLDSIARHAEIGINIANSDYQGKGYGADVMKAIMRYGFEQLNFNRISLKVFAYNTRAVRLYEKLGFQLEVRERDYIYRDGAYYDQLHMGILKREWEASHGHGA